MSERDAIRRAIEDAIAQAWCLPAHEDKPTDAALGDDLVSLVDRVVRRVVTLDTEANNRLLAALLVAYANDLSMRAAMGRTDVQADLFHDNALSDPPVFSANVDLT